MTAFNYSLLIISMSVGVSLGMTLQEHLERPKVIENGAGHYNMISGQFEWGAPPKIVEVPTSTVNMLDTLTEYSKQAVQPAGKVTH